MPGKQAGGGKRVAEGRCHRLNGWFVDQSLWLTSARSSATVFATLASLCRTVSCMAKLCWKIRCVTSAYPLLHPSRQKPGRTDPKSNASRGMWSRSEIRKSETRNKPEAQNPKGEGPIGPPGNSDFGPRNLTRPLTQLNRATLASRIWCFKRVACRLGCVVCSRRIAGRPVEALGPRAIC